MSSVHKEVAKGLVEALEDPNCTDISPLQAVASKSLQIVDRLSKWFPQGISLSKASNDGNTGGGGGGDDVVSQFKQVMKREGIPANVEKFLWGVAIAEPRLVPSSP